MGTMTSEQKKQKRAPSDARCAWRAMSDWQRMAHLDFIVDSLEEDGFAVGLFAFHPTDPLIRIEREMR